VARPAAPARPAGLVWVLLAVPAVVVVLAVIVAVAVPTFLGARERAQQRQAARVDAAQPRLATPETIGGIGRATNPALTQVTADLAQRQQEGGYTNAMGAVYGPDAQHRLLFVTAVRTTSASKRTAYVRSMHASSLALVPDAQAAATPSSPARGGVTFDCATVPGNLQRISAVCTWDGDTAGVGYVGIPVSQLADLLAEARVTIRRLS